MNLLNDANRVLEDWKRMPLYPVQEELLKTLVKRYPNNEDLDRVNLKVKTLNLFYSTGIRATNALSEHIAKEGKKIDEALKKGDPNVVSLIAKLKLEGGTERNNYSFATKYCALHNPNKYPIFDSIVSEVFLTLLEKGLLEGYPYSRAKRPSTYSRASLLENMKRDYAFYIKLYDSFMKQYCLTKLSYRQVDWYLWSSYKIADNTYEIETLAPIKLDVAKVKLIK